MGDTKSRLLIFSEEGWQLLSLYTFAPSPPFSQRWTNQLNLFAVMKIGAPTSDDIALAFAASKSRRMAEMKVGLEMREEHHEGIRRRGLEHERN